MAYIDDLAKSLSLEDFSLESSKEEIETSQFTFIRNTLLSKLAMGYESSNQPNPTMFLDSLRLVGMYMTLCAQSEEFKAEQLGPVREENIFGKNALEEYIITNFTNYKSKNKN